jgi:hypothetical protein
MAARFNWSLGAIKPTPPKTCRGTMKMEEAMAAFFIKFRRDWSEDSFLGCFMIKGNFEIGYNCDLMQGLFKGCFTSKRNGLLNKDFSIIHLI